MCQDVCSTDSAARQGRARNCPPLLGPSKHLKDVTWIMCTSCGRLAVEKNADLARGRTGCKPCRALAKEIKRQMQQPHPGRKYMRCVACDELLVDWEGRPSVGAEAVAAHCETPFFSKDPEVRKAALRNVLAKLPPERLHESVAESVLRPFASARCACYKPGDRCLIFGEPDEQKAERGKASGCIMLAGYPCAYVEAAMGDPANLPPRIRQAYARGALLSLVMFDRRKCPECGAPLARRRRLCDGCRRKRRLKAKRNAAARRRTRAQRELAESVSG